MGVDTGQSKQMTHSTKKQANQGKSTSPCEQPAMWGTPVNSMNWVTKGQEKNQKLYRTRGRKSWREGRYSEARGRDAVMSFCLGKIYSAGPCSSATGFFPVGNSPLWAEVFPALPPSLQLGCPPRQHSTFSWNCPPLPPHLPLPCCHGNC